MALGWKVVYDGKTPPPGEAVAPDERLSWGRTVGLGAQHVVAMFGATFVFPLIMGLNPQLAIMMSGIAHDLLPADRAGQGAELPRHVARPSSAVSPRSAPRAATPPTSPARSWSPASCCSLVGVLIHFARLRGAARGAAAGGHRRRRHADRLQPRPGGGRHLLAAGPVGRAADDDVRDPGRRSGVRGFLGRIAIFLGLIFGYLLSWLFDRVVRARSRPYNAATGKVDTHDRAELGRRQGRRLDRLPAAQRRWPTASSAGTRRRFSVTFTLLVLPAVIALIAENTGHVKAVAEMTNRDLDPVMGRAIAADGFGTVTRLRGRRLAHHDVRREHRGDGGDPGLLDGRLLRRGGRGDPVRALPEVRRARRPRPPAACSAGSRSCSTA